MGNQRQHADFIQRDTVRQENAAPDQGKKAKLQPGAQRKVLLRCHGGNLDNCQAGGDPDHALFGRRVWVQILR